MEVSITIPGPAVPWQRTATSEGRRLTPASQRAYQRHVRACASSSLLGREWDRTLRYEVTIGYVPQDRRRRDLDNVAKTLLDACNGVLWDDDSQVDTLIVYRNGPRPTPGIGMDVRSVETPRTAKGVKG